MFYLFIFSDGALLCNMARAMSQGLSGATFRLFRHFSWLKFTSLCGCHGVAQARNEESGVSARDRFLMYINRREDRNGAPHKLTTSKH